MTKKRGAKGRIKFMLSESPAAKKVKKTARDVGESLGLYPEEPSAPAPAAKKGKPCGEAGCDISDVHRHAPLRYEYKFDDNDEPMGTPGPNHPANRAHFDHGSAEHLPEGVVSLNAYRESKNKRPPGY